MRYSRDSSLKIMTKHRIVRTVEYLQCIIINGKIWRQPVGIASHKLVLIHCRSLKSLAHFTLRFINDVASPILRMTFHRCQKREIHLIRQRNSAKFSGIRKDITSSM